MHTLLILDDMYWYVEKKLKKLNVLFQFLGSSLIKKSRNRIMKNATLILLIIILATHIFDSYTKKFFLAF